MAVADSNETRRRKSPRLEAPDYFGPLIAHVINVTRLREPFFTRTEFAEVYPGARGGGY
jgi:hypothetical protein